MPMNSRVRRITLTTHVTSSVGWLGAALVFLALAVVAVTSDDQFAVRGAYLTMEPAAWLVLVPLAHVSLLSGIALSLGTAWGLFRHYWVVGKLLITVFATVILLVYMSTFRQMAGIAADPTAELAVIKNPSPIVHAALAFLLLLVATVLGVYKPAGLTAYGRRTLQEQRLVEPSRVRRQASKGAGADSGADRRWMYLAGITALALGLLFVLIHLAGGGLQQSR